MLSTMQTLFVSAASILGALIAAALGWLDSGEPFSARKFTSSMLHAVFAGGVTALRFSVFEALGPWDYLEAGLAGAGIDVLGNRIEGAISARKTSTTPPASQPLPAPPAPAPTPTPPASTETFVGDYQGWDVYIRQGRLIVYPPANLTANLGPKMDVGSTEGYAQGTDFLLMARTFIDQQIAIITAPGYGQPKTPPTIPPGP